MKFHEFLEKDEACEKARRWVGEHGLKWAWDNCEHPGWMLWLLVDNYGDENSSWPTRKDVQALNTRLRKRYTILKDVALIVNGAEYRHVAACNFIRKHIKPGKLSELTARYED